MIFTRPDQIYDPLYVVTVVFNSQRYRSRWKLWADFSKMIKDAGGILYTTEVAFGDRDFALRDLCKENYTQLRVRDELWYKENAINISVTKLPVDWKYAAWIDADVIFSRPDFINETLHKLQHHKIVQMWSQSVDLSPQHEIMRTFRSYAYCFNNGVPRKGLDQGNDYYAGEYWHSGYAWATRRDAFDALGGLVDFSILGGADLWMANMLFGQEFKYPKSLGYNGIKKLQIWKNRADKYIKQNVGYVEGLICHHWHGKKVDRKYQDRGTILTDAHFDPDIDLIRDAQGLWQLNPDNIKLREGIRHYLKGRNEDSIDV